MIVSQWLLVNGNCLWLLVSVCLSIVAANLLLVKVAGCWTIVAGQWLLVNSCLSMIVGQWLLAMIACQWLLANGCWLIIAYEQLLLLVTGR
jgi:hypothetical protein